MRAPFKAALGSSLATTLLYRLVHAYSLTLRLTVENEQPWLTHLQEGGKVLLCVWHQQFFAMIRHYERYRPYRPSIMISRSQDGEMVARIAEKSGWLPVRGSSSRGGSQALKLMIEKLKETGLAAHVVDGPRGPAGKIKSGTMHLAQAAGAAIVPVSVSAEKAWYFRSWDRFLLPKPFSRVTVRYGDILRFPATDDPAELERQRQSLENIMAPCLKL